MKHLKTVIHFQEEGANWQVVFTENKSAQVFYNNKPASGTFTFGISTPPSQARAIRLINRIKAAPWFEQVKNS